MQRVSLPRLEETRQFYEDFLGLPLAATLKLGETKTGRECSALHTFYRMRDGSSLAFFEVPDQPYEFKDWHDFDLHIALEVDYEDMLAMKAKVKPRIWRCVVSPVVASSTRSTSATQTATSLS